MWPSANRAEFEQLVREHLPDALRLATRLVSCPETAEDVVQNALLRASKGWRSFRKEAHFQTWLFRIVVNCSRDFHRKVQRASAELADGEIDTKQREPVYAAQDQELQALIEQTVQTLPDRQREVLVLHTFEQMATAEIGKALEMSQANVHSTLHAARQRMTLLLQPYLAEM